MSLSFLGRIVNPAVEKSVINIKNQLSLDFSGTKHIFRKVTGANAVGNGSLFAVSTCDYGDIMNVAGAIDETAVEDGEVPMNALLASMNLIRKGSNPTFEVTGNEILRNKSGDSALGAILYGHEVLNGKPWEIIYLVIPTTAKFLNDSQIAITVLCPQDAPQSLKDDLKMIVTSIDIHTDHK